VAAIGAAKVSERRTRSPSIDESASAAEAQLRVTNGDRGVERVTKTSVKRLTRSSVPNTPVTCQFADPHGVHSRGGSSPSGTKYLAFGSRSTSMQINAGVGRTHP
jgi:hypothetical protein